MTARSNSFAIVVLSTLVVAIAIIAWSVAADRSHSGPNAVALAAGSCVPDATPATTDSPRPSSTLTTLRDAEGVGAIALAHIESMAETGRAMGLDGADERFSTTLEELLGGNAAGIMQVVGTVDR